MTGTPAPADCLNALAQNDPAGVTDVLLDMVHAKADVRSRELRAEIEEMMNRYARADIADTVGQTMLSEMMSIVRSHSLQMPTEYVMLFQTLGVLQGVVVKLDGETKLLDVAEPYIRRAAIEGLPERVGRAAVDQLRQYARVATRIPDTLDSLLGHITQAQLGVNVKLTNSDEVLDRTEAIANRFSLTSLLSAVAIALALVAGRPVPAWVHNATYAFHEKDADCKW